MTSPATDSESAPPIPWMALIAVMLGTSISTLSGRFTTFGLGDIKGALHIGFDEGSWIPTAQSAAQMFVAPFAVWAGGALGTRRTLLAAASAFTAISLFLPYASNLPTFLIMQFLSGLASGFFVPLTLSFLLRNTNPRFWALGVAIYALNLELSLNISASVEGWFVDNLSWHWIFWQNVPLSLAMTIFLAFGRFRDPTNAVRPPIDAFGIISCGMGMALVYVGLDQGNRLDWFGSGLVTALMVSGAILLIGFVINEAVSSSPLLNLKFAFSSPIILLLVLVGILRLTILGTSYLVPQYLQIVRGYRTIEIGQTLVWIAVPQIVICPFIALLLRRFDARSVSAVGFLMIGLACISVATGLTPIWGTDQFLPSQLIQAIGQAMALSAVVFFGVLHLKPNEALTFGAAFQMTRLIGGELGFALISTLTRIRTQTASQTIGNHVQHGDVSVLQRLRGYTILSRAESDPTVAISRGTAIFANAIRNAASTQGIIDAFIIVGAAAIFALFLAVFHQPAPEGPASHRPIFPKTRRPE